MIAAKMHTSKNNLYFQKVEEIRRGLIIYSVKGCDDRLGDGVIQAFWRGAVGCLDFKTGQAFKLRPNDLDAGAVWFPARGVGGAEDDDGGQPHKGRQMAGAGIVANIAPHGLIQIDQIEQIVANMDGSVSRRQLVCQIHLGGPQDEFGL